MEDGLIAAVELDESTEAGGSAAADTPFIAPGFVDVHVHGGGGHDAMGGADALTGMARHLLRHGVTSFLPTAVSAPIPRLVRFAEEVRGWLPVAPADGAGPLGFDLEGPFLAPSRRGAHDPAHLRVPAEVDLTDLEPLLDGLRLMTVAPELSGAVELISWLRGRGVAISLGHSAADLEAARAGYAAGATSTTHLFNAMSGVDHHAPGLAVAALRRRCGLRGTDRRWRARGPVAVADHRPDQAGRPADARQRCDLDGRDRRRPGHDRRAGGRGGRSARDAGRDGDAGRLGADPRRAVRNLVAFGLPLPAAVAAAGRNPLAMLGIADRGRLAAGQRADLVELDAELRVRRVMRVGPLVRRRG